MKESIIPFSSAAVRYTVPPGFGIPGPGAWARFMSISFARSPRYAASSICAVVTSIAAGSATWRHTSANASFIASICRCTLSAESTGCDARSKWRRIPSAINAAMPWQFGGISCR